MVEPSRAPGRRALPFRGAVENHPGAVNPLNTAFSQWLEVGYRQALDRARSCNSYEGYRFALEAYAIGFQDVHLGLWTELRREGVRWPGFMVGWQPQSGKNGGKLLVRLVGEGKAGRGRASHRQRGDLVRRKTGARADRARGVSVLGQSGSRGWMDRGGAEFPGGRGEPVARARAPDLQDPRQRALRASTCSGGRRSNSGRCVHTGRRCSSGQTSTS